MRWTGVLVFTGVAALAVPALAHHSIAAMYDRDRTVEVRGVLSKVELINPHAMMEVTVPARSGPPTVWAVESRGVQGMTRIGFERGSIAVGEKVTVKGAPARDGGKSLWLNTLEMAGGKVFDFSMSGRGRNP